MVQHQKIWGKVVNDLILDNVCIMCRYHFNSLGLCKCGQCLNSTKARSVLRTQQKIINRLTECLKYREDTPTRLEILETVDKMKEEICKV